MYMTRFATGFGLALSVFLGGIAAPVAAKTLALELPADAWQQIKWRDGSNTPLTSRFARWAGPPGA